MSYLGHTGYSRCADLFVSLAPLSHTEPNLPEPGFNLVARPLWNYDTGLVPRVSQAYRISHAGRKDAEPGCNSFPRLSDFSRHQPNPSVTPVTKSSYIVLFFKCVQPACASADSLFRGCCRLSCRFLPMFSAKSEQVRGCTSAQAGALCSVLPR